MSELTNRILSESKTVAVVGLSTNPNKAAHSVPAALQAAGFTIIPVHPKATQILGQKAYPRLSDIPDPVDLVVVFRPSPEAPGVAKQAVSIGAKALWLQLGLESQEARLIAERGGLLYVEDRCSAVERARYNIVKRESAAPFSR